MRVTLPIWFCRVLGLPVAVLALMGFAFAAGAQPAPSASEQSAPGTLDAATRKAVVDTLAQDLARDYAHPAVGERMAAAIRGKLAAGAYKGIDSPAAFAGALTADVHAVATDKHFRVWFSSHSGLPMPSGPVVARAMMARMKKMNGAIPQVAILAGNIGYMEVNGMPPLPLAKRAIAAAFAFLHNTDALIIDLRGNGGGDPQTDALYMSFLSRGAPYVVNQFHWRSPERITETETTNLGTLSYGSQKLVLCLTSQRTFSGGEELAYDVQAFKRGVIVGERTGGGANPSDVEQLGHGFWALVPDGYVVNPATGGNWEGRGVTPDVPVSADMAVVTAERLAIAKLMTRSTDPGERAALEAVGRELAMRAAAIGGHAGRKLDAMQLVGAYRSLDGRVGVAPGGGGLTQVIQRGGQLFLEPSVPNMPPTRLVATGENIYHLSGYPSDFTAAFSRSRAGDVRLVLDIGVWPAAILRRVTVP